MKTYSTMNIDSAPESRHNHLLDALPAAEWARWRPRLEQVDLALGQVLSEEGHTPTFAFFPTTAVVSLISTTQDGDSAEFAVVGNDGVVGISLVMGGHSMPGNAVVQSAGRAWRMRAQAIRDEAAQAGPALELLLRYTQSLMAQVAETAACNRHHTVDQLLCRRLLLGLDRAPNAALVMTHELLANLLGVRRESVTAAAMRLAQAGAIRYRRGHIDVLDRAWLEQGAASRERQSRPQPQQRWVRLPLNSLALAA